MSLLIGCAALTASGCGNDSSGNGPGSSAGPDAAVDAGPTLSPTFQEAVLTLKTKLTVTPATTDVPASAVLEITARDGVTPVITDLWLYTYDGTTQTPLTGFTSTAARKSPGLLLPATVAGQPSGLIPANDGRVNGLLTNTVRGTLVQGAFVSSATGTVNVTLPAVPTTAILVVAGVEDQRYTGAAVINPDGTPGTVPAGVGMPETHKRVTYADVKPLLGVHCIACHNPTHANNADFYKVTGSRDDLVNNNFALAENTLDCRTANPSGGVTLDQCIQAITKAEYLVEPGVPALTDLLVRARPDETGGSSPTGLVWWGSKGVRYNATYGDRRMPSTTESTDPTEWAKNLPTDFDNDPTDYQVIYDWVAQGAQE
ncbi:MAG TPA: hypothetical protein VH165_21095 [Kofleriaceae bacterium]|nr:hypothetical protein [Kofleriaceae bacterium]